MQHVHVCLCMNVQLLGEGENQCHTPDEPNAGKLTDLTAE